jgi:ABC-type transporter Mla subunit MlaD
MKISKFYEANSLEDISNDRIKEILNSLRNTSDVIDDKIEEVQSFLSEFEKFKGKSRKSNDQIDDTILNLESLKSKMSDILKTISSVNENLTDYKENGRRYLY